MVFFFSGEGSSVDHPHARARYTCRGYVAEGSDVFWWQKGRLGHWVVDVVGVKTFCWICGKFRSPEFLDCCVFYNQVEDSWSIFNMEAVGFRLKSTIAHQCTRRVFKLYLIGKQNSPRHNFMSYFKMNSLAWNNMLDNNFADNRNWGCLDEFWYVTALYGTMKKVHTTGDQSIELPEFTGSPLRIDQSGRLARKMSLVLIWRFESYLGVLQVT